MNYDQATDLRQLARQRNPLGGAPCQGAPLVVVSGGSHGVGTTTVAVNLAVALARQGRRTVLVDADLQRGGRIRFHAQRDPGNVVDVLAGRCGVHEVLARGPAGVQVLMGAAVENDANACSAAAHERFVGQLRSLAPHAEVVVLDVGNSRSPIVRRFWQAADAIWTITTPDDEAILACYGTIKSLLADGASLAVQPFVNGAASENIAADVQGRLTEACRRFLGVRATSAGSAPRSEASAAAGECFAPGLPTARAFDAAADSLWTQLQHESGSLTNPRRVHRRLAS